jgi:hypothetical protein
LTLTTAPTNAAEIESLYDAKALSDVAAFQNPPIPPAAERNTIADTGTSTTRLT